MEQLAELLNDALAHTVFKSNDATIHSGGLVAQTKGVELNADEFRTAWTNLYWGDPCAYPIRQATPQTSAVMVGRLANHLRTELADYVDADSDSIGHAFRIIGQQGGLDSISDWVVSQKGTSQVSTFASSLIRAAAILGSDRAAQMVIGWSQGEPLRTKTCILMGEGTAVGEAVDSGHGLRIFALPVRSDEFPVAVPERSTLSTHRLLGQVILEMETTTRPAIFRPEGHDDASHRLSVETALGDVPPETFCLAMSLVCNRGLTIGWSWIDYGETRAFGAEDSLLWLSSSNGEEPPLLLPRPDARVKPVSDFVSHASATNVTALTGYVPPQPNLFSSQLGRSWELTGELRRRIRKDSRFRVAVTRWYQSALPGVMEADRLIDLRIALEALYLDPGRGRLAFRLARASALRLGQTLEEGERIKCLVRRFYPVASQVVHGDDVREIKRKYPDLTDGAAKLCRDGILKLLET